MPDQRTYTKDEIEEMPERQHRRVARATRLMTALKPVDQYLASNRNNPTVEERVADLYSVLDAYWRAIREMNYEPFAQADDYVLQKTPGIFALHIFGLKAMKDMRQGRRSLDVDNFTEFLANCARIQNEDFWYVGEKDANGTVIRQRGEAATFGSMNGFSQLADDLYDDLRH